LSVAPRKDKPILQVTGLPARAPGFLRQIGVTHRQKGARSAHMRYVQKNPDLGEESEILTQVKGVLLACEGQIPKYFIVAGEEQSPSRRVWNIDNRNYAWSAIN